MAQASPPDRRSKLAVVAAANHYPALLAAARAVVTQWDHGELYERHMKPLRAAVDGADQRIPGDG